METIAIAQQVTLWLAATSVEGAGGRAFRTVTVFDPTIAGRFYGENDVCCVQSIRRNSPPIPSGYLPNTAVTSSESRYSRTAEILSLRTVMTMQ